VSATVTDVAVISGVARFNWRLGPETKWSRVTEMAKFKTKSLLLNSRIFGSKMWNLSSAENRFHLKY
jgi:hypothetical protein